MSQNPENTNVDAIALVARVLLAALFILAGFNKLMAPEGTIAFIDSVGIPLPQIAYVGTVALELLGGLLLLVGFKARYIAAALALFSIATALIFHSDFSVQSEVTAFLKNLAIAGGMLHLAAYGPGRFALGSR